MGVEPPRKHRQQGPQQVAHERDWFYSVRQNRGPGVAGIDERELLHTTSLSEGVPGGMRPEEIVQVANCVEVQEWVPAAEPLHLVFGVQAHDVWHASPSQGQAAYAGHFTAASARPPWH